MEDEGFEKPLVGYYQNKHPTAAKQCIQIKAADIILKLPTCPDCDMKMAMDSVSYKCCHGNHHSATNDEEATMPNVINAGHGPTMLKF